METAVIEPVVTTEQTPLLAHSARREQRRTPIPWKQLSIIMIIQICEPMASQSIYPYINQLISELDITGGDEKKVGYYAGVEALFFFTESLTILQWSRASDIVGRKPILLIGLFGTALSILSFGLSRSFWALVVSRCLCGLLNGNVGVMKSTLGDLTDRTNRADVFVFLPIVWSFGASVGPLIGGSLARPHNRFPNSKFFALRFWLEFPYFLPCVVTGSFVFVAWFIVLVFFKETVPWKTQKDARKASEPSTPALESPPASPSPSAAQNGPLPLRDLLTESVVLSVSNYVALGLLNTSILALLPLFLTMPISIGGLGLTPPQIGAILCAYGFVTGTFQLLFFSRIVRRIGEKRTFLVGMSTNLVIFLLFPVMNTVVRSAGLGWGVYGLLALLVFLFAVMDISFGAVFMFVTASAPKSSRGTVNGISQTSVAIARAIGPAAATSLFSLSEQLNLLGGYFVYVVFFGASCAALVLGGRLPEEVWDDIE
ncbi:Major facilitator superfamily multidrug-resistance DHA1 sub-family [Mycena kentingensis (nom. inval.)]|nr:Major facilitator superfamily multidrug-resistance DHA1 sub-family [Mycena kentingensis (nom. inval.)]